jgi:alpha-D-ribose 1-methylphosphonate 5-triphosphate diphosphatase
VYLTHAKIVLAEQIVEDGALLIEDGTIAAINPQGPVSGAEVDLRGAVLLPGLVDLHCDALEKEVEPRPNVRFPIEFALREADKRNALSGVTTPFHALSFAGEELGVRNNDVAGEIARTIRRHADQLTVDHRVHCRYEMTDPHGVEIVLGLMEEGASDLVSFMDHTPGQGQFREPGAYESYLRNTYGKSEKEARQLVAQKGLNRPEADTRVERLAEGARIHGIPLASHDDDSPERIRWLRRLNGRISEFPINLETARAAREMGIRTMFGAPNVLRGESQSGSMRALEGVGHGVIDILCSDYHPGTLLPALCRIAEESSWSLPEAVALATTNPAQAVPLHDRGTIEVGKRADLIAVHGMDPYPDVVGVWVNGRLSWNKEIYA